MDERVWCGVRGASWMAAIAMMLMAPVAGAQTTLVLDAPDTEVVDTTIRDGSYASTNQDGGLLMTRESDDTPSYIRRALLKFDTERRIPAKTRIASAVLTLTVRAANDSQRRIGAYRVAQSFDERAVTWNYRKRGYRWRSAGGDLGQLYAEAAVSGRDGVKVTFDLTSLVQETVNGKFGSRYTRVALVDIGGTGDERDTYREYYSSEASNPAVRPRLVVTYGAAPPRPTPADDEEEEEDEEDQAPEDDEEAGPKPPSSSRSLKVLHWNTHHGRDTRGRYDIENIAEWIARMNPDVVSLNEVEKKVGGHGNEDQPARYAALLRAKTGRTWYYHFAQRYSAGAGAGQGNLLLSRFPIDATASLDLACSRSAAVATVVAYGRTITVLSTHLDNESSSCRNPQIAEIRSAMAGFAGAHVVAGDWNATPRTSEYKRMLDDYRDTWAEARARKKAVDIPGNSEHGASYKSLRIDYIFARGSALKLQKAQMFDTRSGDGVRASDHRPLVATFTVQ